MDKKSENTGILNISGGNIKKYREVFGLTQQELVERMKEYRVGVTEEQLENIENLKEIVTDTQIKCLCDIFNIQPSELLDEALLEKNIKVIWSI